MARSRSYRPSPAGDQSPAEARTELCARPDRGDLMAPTLEWADHARTVRPWDADEDAPPPEVFRRTRVWHRENFFVRGLFPRLVDFVNHGLTVELTNKAGKKGRSAEPWLTPARRSAIRGFVRRALAEALMQDNLLVFWRENFAAKGIAPQLLPPERVRFWDSHGEPLVKYRVALAPEQLDTLAPALQRRYQDGEVTFGDAAHATFNRLNPALAETVRTWKTSAPGHGLAWPALVAAFRTCAQSDSMEVGEEQYAFAGRLVVRQHKVGHEIKGGPKAGNPTNFYKAERGRVIKPFFRGAVGFREWVGNFDHSVELLWTDPKKYDAKKWETVRDRLVDWAGPLGRMLTARGVTPDLANALQVQCQAIREDLREFLQEVCEQAFDAPHAVRLRWKSDCFRSARLQAELLKFGVTTGPTSLRTFAETVHGDDALDREMEHKADEQADEAKLVPLFLPNNGGLRGGKPALSAPGGAPKAGERQ